MEVVVEVKTSPGVYSFICLTEDDLMRLAEQKAEKQMACQPAAKATAITFTPSIEKIQAQERERVATLIDQSMTFWLADKYGVYAKPRILDAITPRPAGERNL